jgi:hypothetical protein
MTRPVEDPEVEGGMDSASEANADGPVEESLVSPGDALRSLPVEAERRGTRYVSALAMQARLFSVYDAAAAAEGALALVQDQLTRTLDRRYYMADEIEEMAAELDALLALDSIEVTGRAAGAESLTDDDTADAVGAHSE